MDKQLIERIAMEVAKEVTPEFVWEEDCNHEYGVFKHELYEFAAKFLTRIDAERGKEAVTSQFQSNDGKWYPFLNSRHKEDTIAAGYPVRDLFLSPTIPEGMALVSTEILDRFPEINPSNYDHDDACALNAWGVELVLAAAQGERK